MHDWLASLPQPEFNAPERLLLLPLLLLMWLVLNRRNRHPGQYALQFPGIGRLSDAGLGAPRWKRSLVSWLRSAALVAGVLALAEPRLHYRSTEAEARGIDVVLAMDISESMLQRDQAGKSRLEIAREIARSYVLRRTHDRISLVVFRGQAYTQAPLTSDHRLIGMLLEQLGPAVIREEGTAIGSAILIAVNRLKASESPNRIVILVTDGENNTGPVTPLTASGVAAGEGVRIYAVDAAKMGAGTLEEEVAATVSGTRGSGSPSATTLQQLARATGGLYFNATDRSAFFTALQQIDRQEKKLLSATVVSYRRTLQWPLTLLMLLFLSTEIILSNTRFLRIP